MQRYNNILGHSHQFNVFQVNIRVNRYIIRTSERGSVMIYTDDAYIKETLRPRSRDAHKGNFGKTLVFAGSPGMAGAAVLCGSAALRGGAGLVQFFIASYSSPIYPVLQTAVPEATCMEYKEDFDISGYAAIAAGPGLGTSDDTAKILKTFLADAGPSVSIVLDADALNIISKDPDATELTKKCEGNIIMTPHIGEAKRLLKKDAQITSPAQREAAAHALSQEYNAVIILKGAGSLVAAPDGSIFENLTGNPGMATAGSGDVLTGLIASLCSQGYSAISAARMGVFLHGVAGDLAAADLSEPGLISSDICRYIPRAFKLYYKKKTRV